MNGLTSREQKALEHSWAKTFAEDIFPAIDEKPFSVLYSSNASRPNTPVNICIGALIIKEIFGISDDELVENLMLDPRYQYALHTTSCEEQPLSDKSLSRFRKRCYDYESAYGVDLLHDCLTGLSGGIARLMDINPRIKRMDSMMIAANIRKLSRIELLYTCVSRLVIYLHNNKKDDLLKGMEHYYDPDDYNKTFYYNTLNETGDQINTILHDADKLLSLCGAEYDDVTEYQLLVRCLSEQTVVEEASRRLRTKEDGAYSGKENHDLAAEKNIQLVNTDLSGKPVDSILAEFVFNEEGTKVLRCPAGYEPKSCSYTGEKSQQFHLSFQRDQCADCPNKDHCKAKIHKKVSSVIISVKSHERAR